MRPVSVFAKAPGSEIEQLRGDLQGRWRQAARAVMVLLSLHGLPPSPIAELLDCHPATVRRWIGRFDAEGLAGLADRPRSGRPRLGGCRLAGRIAALPERPGPWTLPRIRRYLGWPQVGMRTLYRRVRLVAGMAAAEADRPRRPGPRPRGGGHRGPAGQAPAPVGGAGRGRDAPEPAAARAGQPDTARHRPPVLTPGTNRKVTVLGALEMTTGARVYRLGRRCAADLIALPDQLLRAFPAAPVIAVICDNDSIHHARKVTAYLKENPRIELLYGARYSPHDNPAERIWGALKNYVANTAVTWPGRLKQIRSFFRNRSPDQMLATAAPWTSPWLHEVTNRTFGMPLSRSLSS